MCSITCFKKKPSTWNQGYYFMLLNIMEQMPHNCVTVTVRPMSCPIVSSPLSFCLEFVCPCLRDLRSPVLGVHELAPLAKLY